MRRAIETILAILGCAILALVVGLVLSGLSASGVVSMQITHALFWLAFVISIVAGPLATWLIAPSWKNCLASFLATTVLVGGGLWWLDSWLVVKKTEQDAANIPVTPLRMVATSPSVPIIKTPRPLTPAPKATKPQQDNSVHIGRGASVEQNSKGDCSPNIIGGSNNVTCGVDPKQAVITYFYDGGQRISRPGYITDAPGEHDAFDKIMDLNSHEQWADLASLCDAEISKAPDWITPYYYKGLAEANLQNLNRSIELFKYVESHAAGNPDYGNLVDRAKELRAKVEQARLQRMLAPR